MNILIVDDHPDNIFLVQRLLEKAGYKNLQTAACAQEAFNLLNLSVQPGQVAIDLILMDVMMPDMNGIEACEVLKNKDVLKDIPVIMMTALTDQKYLQAAFEAGAVDYVTKPLKAIEMLARIRSTLRLKQEMDNRKKREQELEVRNQELEKATSEIKTLREFLPICSYCKNIRDVKGYWHQIEAYMSQHSEIVFTHGICDGCMKVHYAEFVKPPKKTPPQAA